MRTRGFLVEVRDATEAAQPLRTSFVVDLRETLDVDLEVVIVADGTRDAPRELHLPAVELALDAEKLRDHLSLLHVELPLVVEAPVLGKIDPGRAVQARA